MRNNRRLLLSIMTLVVSLLFGTIIVDVCKSQFNGIHNLFDSLYFTVVTYATLGSYIEPQTTLARMIVILLVLIGVGSFATILAWVVVPFIENKIKGVLMMVSTIENIQGHVVVFGVNAISLEIMKAYHANHRNILVVTQNHLHIKLLDTLKLNYILGDATCETIIKKSGAVDAQTILCSLEDDANNLLLLMMIQDVLRDRAHKKQAPAIIAMIQDPNNADKAQRNGATQVITPALLALDSLRDKKLI